MSDLPLLNPGGSADVPVAMVIAMAGHGSRFASAGYRIAKPLIPVAGIPMYAWSVASLPLASASPLVFVLQRAMPGFDALHADIMHRFAAYAPRIVVLDRPTGGQGETVLRAMDEVDEEGGLLVHNADTAFATSTDWLRRWVTERVDGGWLVFESRLPRWSFIEIGESGRATRVTEKDPISDLASTGTYYFRRAGDFARLARAAIERQALVSGESYIAPLYQSLIDAGQSVVAEPIDELFCFGTPEDLAEAEPRFRARLAAGPAPARG